MTTRSDEIRSNLDAALQNLSDNIHLPDLDTIPPIPKEKEAHNRFHTAEHYLDLLPKDFLSKERIKKMSDLWEKKKFLPVLNEIQELRRQAKIL